MSVHAASCESLTTDQLDALGDEIATFAARIDVAEHALITRLRVFDAHEAWGRAGFKSCAEWLSWRIGIGIKAAREKVRVARALGTLKKVDALFGRGELSYSKVRAITRVATPESEQDFIDVASHATASQIERLSRAYQRVRDALRGPMALPRNHRRFVRRSETFGGMVRIEMQLPPEEAAVVWSAMMSAMDREPPASAQTSAGASASQPPQASAEAPVRAGNDDVPLEGWADGGATKLSNLVLVCSGHHRMLHEGKLSAEVRDQQIAFRNQIGRELPGVPESAASGHDLEELERYLQEGELYVDAETNRSKWDGSKVALAEMLDWMFTADRTRGPHPRA